MKILLLIAEDLGWALRCKYNRWIHGPYGLAKVIEKIPFAFLIKYLRKYGATIGEGCRFERGVNLHRPFGKKPFENLHIGNNVYLGHKIIIDLTRKVNIEDDVIIASGCQIWTHSSEYLADESGRRYDERTGDVTIGTGSIIYSGVVVSSGVTVGANARIGANSLVNKNVPESSFAGGVPAKVITLKK